MTEELYIDGVLVDLKPDATTTLNYKSNLFGEISKITSSNSQTIQCPKTTRNRKIFDNPGAPAYISSKRYSRYSAYLLRNGIEIIGGGYAVLLSASECYEIALYWGVMANFQAWIDKAAKLNELSGTEYISWNKSISMTRLSLMESRGYGYARYGCGVSNADLINIHPSVTAWWLFNKIATQAGFTFEMPSKYMTALKSIAIPCLQKNSSPESWEAEKTFVSTYCTTIREFLGMDPNTGGAPMAYAVGYINVKSNTQIHPVYLGNNISYGYYANYSTSGDISWPHGTDYRTVYMAEFSTLSLDEMEIYINALSVNLASSTSIEMYAKKDGADYTVFKSWALSSGQEIRETINCSNFDKYYFILKNPKQESAAYEINIEIIPHADQMTYPSVFRIILNLPDISQIDFIKAICAMLGIFVVPDPSNANHLKFVSIEVLQTNKTQAQDWSDRLVASNEDEPKTVEFKINDYCRNNYFKYKEDDTVAANADGNLKIANETLEKEKTVITLPFAPSDGSKIPHYKLSDDGTEVEDVNIKDRIMSLIDNGSERAALTFDGLEFETLLSKYYTTLSRLLNSAITITEGIMLNEFELKSLDYATPFYLRQYGKYYGIISVQSTAGKACEVKAVQLPETVIEEPERPSQTVSIGWISSGSAVYVKASASPTSDLNITVTPYTYDGVALGQKTIILPAGQTQVSAMSITQIFGWLVINSITPEYDDTYSYIIAEQTTKTE